MEKRKILNLAHLEKSDIKYKKTIFPDGEPHIEFEKIDNKYPVVVKTRICNPNDLYTLLLVRDVLDRWGVFYDTEISYLMSARMDRLMDITRPVSLGIVQNVLDIPGEFAGEQTYIFDCHAKLPCIDLYIRDIMHELRTEFDTFVFPDLSALGRYRCMLETKDKNQYFLACDKLRTSDSVVTNISDEKLDIIKQQQSVAVVDDIIDGGRTVSNVIDIIKKHAPDTKICVYASHCVSFGIDKILAKCDRLITTNSYADWETILQPNRYSSKLQVLEVI